MAEVIWSPEAIQDLEQIAAFIARDSEYHAAMLVQRLVDATDRLARFPESGRIIPEVGASRYREIIEGAYRIMYSIAGDVIRIDAVIHGARDFGRPDR
jgi:plasmid stabilization system protein ParE